MNVTKTLSAVAGTAESIAAQWHAYLAARELLEPSELRASRADRGRGGKGGHADPVCGHVVATLGEDDRTPNDDIVEAIDAWLAQGRWIADRVRSAIAQTNRRPRTDAERLEHERLMRAARCLCTDPNCARLADIDPNGGTEWAGYSTTCRERERKRQQRSGTMTPVVPSGVLETARITLRAPERTIWCRRCDRNVPVPTGIEPYDALGMHQASDRCEGA